MVTKSQQILNTVLAMCFVAYGYLSINMGLPAYPILAGVFHVSLASVKLSMTVFLLGYAVSQVCWGLLSDHYGRKRIVVIGSAIAIVGSVVSSLAPSLAVFMLGRFVEAIGTGFATVLTRAILADMYQGKHLKIMMSYVVIIAALMPAIAPIIGGHLLVFSWHAIYLALALFGVVMLCAAYWQRETIEVPDHHISLPRVKRACIDLFTHRRFMGYLLSYGVLMAGLITFYAIAPFIYVLRLRVLAEHYGYLLLLVGLGYVVGALIVRLLSHYWPSNRILFFGFLVNACVVLIVLAIWLLAGMSILTVTLPMFIFALSCGLVSPTANAAALSCLESHKGLAAALMPSVVMGVSSVATALLAGVHYQTMLPLLGFVAVVFVASFGFFMMLAFDRR